MKRSIYGKIPLWSLLAVSLFLPGCVYYVLNQTWGQMGILLHRQSIEEVHQSPQLPGRYERKFKYIKAVRKFAAQSLDLPSESYQYYYNTGDRPVAYNISASPALEMVPLTWWFPVVGSVPYLGFFDKSHAVQIKYELRSQGYDVLLREVSAYSTLGWFEDPIFSRMLEEKDPFLAELIIHEIAHEHVYISGQAKFNENAATIIGEEGAKAFLRNHFGADSPEYKQYLDLLSDRKLLERFVARLILKLHSLYHVEMEEKKKAAQKEVMIRQAKMDFQKLSFKRDHYKKLYLLEWNNAFLLSINRYRGYQEVLANGLAKKDGNLKKFIQFLKGATDEGTPWKGIKEWLESPTEK